MRGGGDNSMAMVMMAMQAQQQAQIAQQQKIATQNQVAAIQSNVSSDTFSLLRQFGERAARASAAPNGGMSPSGPQLSLPDIQNGGAPGGLQLKVINGMTALQNPAQRFGPTMAGLKLAAPGGGV